MVCSRLLFSLTRHMPQRLTRGRDVFTDKLPELATCKHPVRNGHVAGVVGRHGTKPPWVGQYRQHGPPRRHHRRLGLELGDVHVEVAEHKSEVVSRQHMTHPLSDSLRASAACMYDSQHTETETHSLRGNKRMRCAPHQSVAVVQCIQWTQVGMKRLVEALNAGVRPKDDGHPRQ